MIPDEYGNDEAFLFASEIEHDIPQNRWIVRVNPDCCLVGPAVDRDVECIRNSEHNSTVTGSGKRYNGRLLFSAGVVLLLNGQLVLLRRGPNALTNPEKWQSPAGRCDAPPGKTALSELYEELVVIEDDQPVFIIYEGLSDSFEQTYEAALRRVDRYVEPAQWSRYSGSVPSQAEDFLAKIDFEYGTQQYSNEMVAFFNEEASTLELRHIIEVDVSNPETLRCIDSEYGREVGLFDLDALDDVDDELVPTDAHLRKILYPSLI